MASQEEQYPSPTLLSELGPGRRQRRSSRREAVEDWIAGSPHLRSLYERERAAVEPCDRPPLSVPQRGCDAHQAQRARRCAAPPQAGLCRLASAIAAVVPFPGEHARLAISQAARARAARTVRPRSSR